MDNLKIKQISRDVYVDENSHTYEAIEITQGTNGGIELVFYLYENGIPYILQNSDSIKYKLIGARPDGEAIIRYPKSVSENILVFDNITSFMTCIVGTYSVRIEMADLNGTSNILVNDIQLSIIENSFYNSNIISTDEYSVLMYELNNLDRLTSKIVSNETNVTEGGIALDARQNNPDIDGTLRNQINVLYNNKISKDSIVHNADISDADKIAGMDLINNMQQQITVIKNRLWTGLLLGTAQQTLLSYIQTNLDTGGVVSFPNGVFTDIPIDGWGVAEVVRFDALIWAVTIHYSNVSTTYYNQIYVDKWVWDTWIEK